MFHTAVNRTRPYGRVLLVSALRVAGTAPPVWRTSASPERLAALLRMMGADVSIVAGGQDGAGDLATHRPDLVIFAPDIDLDRADMRSVLRLATVGPPGPARPVIIAPLHVHAMVEGIDLILPDRLDGTTLRALLAQANQYRRLIRLHCGADHPLRETGWLFGTPTRRQAFEMRQ